MRRRPTPPPKLAPWFFLPLAVNLAWVLAILILGLLTSSSDAQTLHLYTKPVSGASGGIHGAVDRELTHALAVNRDRVQCFRGEIGDDARSFRLPGLPTGKYDLVLVTRTNQVLEGLALGDDAEKLTGTPLKHFEERITKADKFFNRAKVHRFGFVDGGELMLAFVERIRDKLILKQSGEVLNSNLRRLEVIDLEKAADDWTMVTSRHIYREEAPVGEGMPFLQHRHVPALGNVRVIDSVKDLGSIKLPR